MNDLVVRVLVVNKGKVLVGLRCKDDNKKSNGNWQLPGGHIEQEEMVFEAATRECFEETGLKIKKLSTLPLIIEQKKTKKIVLSVVAENFSGKLLGKSPEHSAWRWMEKNDLVKKNYMKSTFKILSWYFENYD